MASEFERARDVAMQDSPEYAELIAALKSRALHEYRDEMSRKRRRYRDAYRAEGTIDVMVRHYRNVPTRAIWTYGSAARSWSSGAVALSFQVGTSTSTTPRATKRIWRALRSRRSRGGRAVHRRPGVWPAVVARPGESASGSTS